MTKLIILGGGGHARVLIDLIRVCGDYEIVGILEPEVKVGSLVSGIPVLGNDNLLMELYEDGIKNACIGVGSIKDNSKRKMLYEKICKVGFSVPSLIHPKVILSKDLQLSEGVQIMAGAVVQPNNLVGNNTIINTGVILEHDCRIGQHVHICPGAIVSGGCAIGDGAFIGAGATIIQGIRIGENAVIAAGAVVIRDVPACQQVSGVPAK